MVSGCLLACQVGCSCRAVYILASNCRHHRSHLGPRKDQVSKKERKLLRYRDLRDIHRCVDEDEGNPADEEHPNQATSTAIDKTDVGDTTQIILVISFFPPSEYMSTDLMMLSHDAMRIMVKPNMEIKRKFLCKQSAFSRASHLDNTIFTNPQLLLLSHAKHIRPVV